MKGFMIYETPLWGDEENTVFLQEVENASYTLKKIGSDDIIGYLEGTATKEPLTKAKCSPEDTYDFETGALIALMKMCGVEKVKKAAKETFFDVAENAVNEYEEEIHALKEENKRLTNVSEGFYRFNSRLIDEIDQKNHEIISLKALKLTNESLKKDCVKYTKENEELKRSNESLKKDNESFRKTCEKLKEKIELGICKPRTKREEMWENIFELHKESDVIIKVKKEDVNSFLHEIEKRIPEITWLSTVKMFETKYTIGDIYEELKTCDTIYFRLSKETKLTYSSDSHIYLYRDLVQLTYLPPMRWDLFKNGRIVVKVTYENYKEFYEACEKELGKKPATMYCGDFTVSICKKDGNFEVFTMEHQKKTGKKIVDWEDVR